MEEIFRRRSIRKYTDQPVEAEKLELLLQASMNAPTSDNQQEWEFIVITDRGLLDRLSSASPNASPLRGATAAIVTLWDERRLRYPEYWQQDMGTACENILLEAVHLGLGACWLGIAPDPARMEAVRAIFDLPPNVHTYSILSLGYSAEQPEPRETYRPERIHRNRY